MLDDVAPSFIIVCHRFFVLRETTPPSIAASQWEGIFCYRYALHLHTDTDKARQENILPTFLSVTSNTQCLSAFRRKLISSYLLAFHCTHVCIFKSICAFFAFVSGLKQHFKMYFRERSLMPSYVTMLTTAQSQRYHMLVQRSNSWKRLSNSSVCACVLLCGQLFGETVLPTVQYMSNCFLACMLACALSSIGWLDTPQANSRDILRNILHSYDYCYSFFAERGCTSECFVCSVPFLTNNYILSWKCLESYRLRECYCLIRSYMWRQWPMRNFSNIIIIIIPNYMLL